jgi:L-ascorbate metabolism protein UlaG (beta-lactamase superfamily)
VIHPDLPRFHNSGYVFTLGDTTVYHPGDALTLPPHPIDVLCVPVCAPWMRAAEGIDFARAVAAPRNLAIHDRVYSEAGLRIVDGQYATLLPEHQSFSRIADGADLS